MGKCGSSSPAMQPFSSSKIHPTGHKIHDSILTLRSAPSSEVAKPEPISSPEPNSDSNQKLKVRPNSKMLRSKNPGIKIMTINYA